VVVLETSKKLKVYSNWFIDKKGYLKPDDYFPVNIKLKEGIYDIRLTDLNSNSILIEFFEFLAGNYNDMKYIYLRDENLLITDFTEYLNSYKKQK